MDKKKLVLGVIGADCHAVGNKILDYALTEAGFEVINIGVLSPQEDFINAAVETNADAIIVSSLYGHGEIDCRGLREKCDEAGLKGILIYVGGNIVVGKQDWNEVYDRFKAMGFDRVYPPGTSVDTTIHNLREDLKIAE
ncbi:MAG: methylaspartate mutase subunit S [Clostridium sp.]